MKLKKTMALAALGMALGTVLVISVGAGGGHEKEPLKLEGSWVAKSALGSWIYTFAPSDPSGREAGISGPIIDADPTLGGSFPQAQYMTPFIGQAVVTGPDTAAYTTLGYATEMVGVVPQKVYIAVSSGTVKVTAPGRTEVTHNIALYLASQDADGDGLPDKGQVPVACVAVKSFDTRLPLLPPCNP